jgi:hypothetical protein
MKAIHPDGTWGVGQENGANLPSKGAIAHVFPHVQAKQARSHCSRRVIASVIDDGTAGGRKEDT